MNVTNRTLFIADNLPIMRGIDSDCIDLIYLDPPFGSKKIIKGKKSAKNASFKDFWSEEDIEKEWHGEISEIHEEIYQFIQAAAFLVDQNIKNYLTAMTVRLFEMKRILKPTGSIYLHCDRTASHYLKGILDGLFGKQNFRDEIIWKRHSGHNDKVFGHIHETIFCYSTESVEISDDIRIPITNTTKGQSDHRKRKHGTYTTICLTGPGPSNGESGEPWQNVDPGNRHWSPPLTGEYAKYIEDHFIPNYRSFKSVHKRLDLLDKAELIQWSDDNNPRYKKYKKAQKGKLPQSIWTDIPNCSGKEYIGYPTQKPLKLLERIIKASSNEDDMILDPFCGCATACVAAEKLNRKWIGIDQSPSAEDMTKLRLQEIVDENSDLWNPLEYVTVSNTPPLRTVNETAIQRRLPAYQIHKHELYGLQEGHCRGCKLHYRYKDLTIDHIVPRSKDGTDHIENLQLLCSSCNSIKYNNSQEYLYERLKARDRELEERLHIT